MTSRDHAGKPGAETAMGPERRGTYANYGDGFCSKVARYAKENEKFCAKFGNFWWREIFVCYLNPRN